MIVVSDTDPINYLVLIEQIGLLPALHGKILIPLAVHAELQSADTPPPVIQWALQLPDCLQRLQQTSFRAGPQLFEALIRRNPS